MTETLFDTFGDLGFPLADTDVTDTNLFSAVDPVRDRMLSLFKTAINIELALSTTVTETNSAWFVVTPDTPLAGKLPVEDTFYKMPSRAAFRETALTYPLLALYRMKSMHEEHTLNYEKEIQTWGLDYILGPLKEDDFRRVGGALNAVKKIIHAVIKRRAHPEFEGGAVQFFATVGGLAKIRIVETTEGPAEYGQEGEGLEFMSLHMELETEEHEHQKDGANPDFDGATITIGVGEEQTAVPDLIVVRTEVPQQSPFGDPGPTIDL